MICRLYEAALEADDLISKGRNTIDGPFIHNYPLSCCELISVHLAVVLISASEAKDVQVAKAYDRDLDRWHYWVEVGSSVVDLTAHQFEDFTTPLVCTTPSEMELRFSDVERLTPDQAEALANFSLNPEILAALQVFSKYVKGDQS